MASELDRIVGNFDSESPRDIKNNLIAILTQLVSESHGDAFNKASRREHSANYSNNNTDYTNSFTDSKRNSYIMQNYERFKHNQVKVEIEQPKSKFI
jgi:hypothetical protein